MSVSTEIQKLQISVYMKLDKMSALRFTALDFTLGHEIRREIARVQ